MPVLTQLLAQFEIVVDFAVEDDDQAAIDRVHRLMARRAEIDDRQPAMAETDARFFEETAIVGAPMRERVGHCRKVRYLVPVGLKISRDSAHTVIPASARAPSEYAWRKRPYGTQQICVRADLRHNSLAVGECEVI